jgi:branched-chain amino acid transport system ATP-binding protein
VLRDLRCTFAGGEVTAIVGRNGVGKTTLLATIMGHTSFHAGTIEFGGRSIARARVHERNRLGIGYVPQAREIFPSLTVAENLSVAARPGRWSLARVFELFPRLAERRSHMGNQLSGGEQQMLATGRALMGKPTLLLLDEPLEGLAPIIVDALLRALERLIRDEAMTVILVEQHAKLALQVTESALVLNRGRIVHRGPSADLLRDPERLAALVFAR